MDGGASTAKDESVDPVSSSVRHDPDAETVEKLCAEFLKRYARGAKRSIEDCRILRRHVMPSWSLRKAKGITRRDVVILLDRVEDRSGTLMRNRVFDAVNRFFRFAIDKGAVDASPAARMSRLDKDGQGRHLTGEEIREFWYGLERLDIHRSVKSALRFLLVTGRTRAEVAGAARSEIIDDQALWRLPDMAGNGRESLIPLPQLALQIVADADRFLNGIPKPISNRGGGILVKPKSFRALFPSTQTGKKH